MNAIRIVVALLSVLASAGSVHAARADWVLVDSTGQHPGKVEVDRTVMHGGSPAMVLRVPTDEKAFARYGQTVRAEAYRGRRVRFSAFVKTRGAGSAHLGLLTSPIGFSPTAADFQPAPSLHGDHDWTELAAAVDVGPHDGQLNLVVVLAAEGELWISSPRLEVLEVSEPMTALGPVHERPADGRVYARLAGGWRAICGSFEAFDLDPATGDRHRGRPITRVRRVRELGPEGRGVCLERASIDAVRLRRTRVRLSAWLRSAGPRPSALWARVDPATPPGQALDFAIDRDQMTDAWREAAVVMDIPSNASRLTFGIDTANASTEVTDFKLEVVGPEVAPTGMASLALPQPRLSAE